jgi:hypothetical protein
MSGGGFSQVIKEGNGNTLIITALVAAAIANALPTPADGFYFSLQQKIKAQLESGEITPKEYWTKDIVHYYTFTAAWYVFLILLVLAIGGKYETNAKILVVLISGGLVLGVWKRNIEKDEALRKLRQEYGAKAGA